MTEGSIFRQLLFFSLPLLAGNFFQQCYNTVDSIVLGNFVGKAALAAVGTTTPIINTLIGLFLEPGETAIMANAQSFIFWNSVFYIPLAVLIIYRYTIQGLGYSGLAMFAGVAEMVARAMVGFWFVPLWGYFAACIANPVAWFFACFFLIPAYFVVFRKLQKEKQQEAAAKAR